jgi:hypothetical protein
MIDVAMAQVEDLNATAGNVEREHDLLAADGSVHHFTFEPRKETAVPLALATRWLVGNSGFRVKVDGQVLKLVAPKQVAVQGPGHVMRPNEVVATLDELTLDALLARVQKAGGQGGSQRSAPLGRAAGKKALIEFLMTGDAPTDVDQAPAGEPLGTLVNAA